MSPASHARTILVLGKIADAGTRRLASHGGFALIERPDHAGERFADAADADAIIVRMTPIDRELLAKAPRLRFVARHGVGYDTVDVDALTERGIPLAVTGDVNSGAVAEHTLALMLAMAKRVVAYDQALRAGEFAIRDTFSAIELEGRNVLIVGFGRIGRKVARLCEAFGMSVSIFDPHLPATALAGDSIRRVGDLAEGLGCADFVSVHAPATRETRHMIDRRAIDAMKPGARLVNVARGGLIDEQAVEQALREGKLAGAALDVFEREPPAPTNPLLSSPDTVLSPHSAAFTGECAERMALACAENVIAFFGGGLARDLVVNPQTLQETSTGEENVD